MGTASTNPQESQSMVKFPGLQAAYVMTQTSGSYSQPSTFAAFEDTWQVNFLNPFLNIQSTQLISLLLP